MLVNLHVKNIALIQEVKLELHNNLNLFTGETGAGKSMLIDSIQFAIGNRTSKNIIRKGEQSAYVCLTFKNINENVISFLQDNNIIYENAEISIERTLFITGRTVFKINGVGATRQSVKEVSSLLIDIHGQHEPQSLLEASKHCALLDSFGTQKFLELKNEYQQIYKQWYSVKQQLENNDIDDRKRLQLKDMLSFQINEIESCDLKPNEEDELKSQYEVLAHAEKILIQCQKAYNCIDGNEEAGVTTLVGRASQNIQDVSHISSELLELYNQLTSIEAMLQDVSYDLRRYVDNIEYSPEKLTEVQERLDIIYKLKQKYGNSIEEILDYQQICQKELDELLSHETNKEELEKSLFEFEKKLTKLGDELTSQRQGIANNIEKSIDLHLHDLQMPYAHFKVQIISVDYFSKNGKDEVEFLIQTNLGEDFHPLSKIASGGEISRVMLAIKTVLVLGDTIGTVIFDEIDTGISGVAAQKVGEKLATIAQKRQVICITHLPQIAVMADAHYLIEKNVIENYTQTSLKLLMSLQIEQELCRLMGGIVTKNTLESAKELKDLASLFKQNLV
ncbi:MAG: DNA repair protein RecN [Epulopiscium sp. Nele67-Bin005]|nr:MAG: DNA repair protein RecN [Epulopiscium sp. Nele67-Bin005]